MRVCTPLEDFSPDARTQAELAQIAKMQEAKTLLPALLAGSQFLLIFFKADVAQASYNISQTDWNILAQAMKKSPDIITVAIQKRAEANWAHYQLHYDRKHIIFWRNLIENCD